MWTSKRRRENRKSRQNETELTVQGWFLCRCLLVPCHQRSVRSHFTFVSQSLRFGGRISRNRYRYLMPAFESFPLYTCTRACYCVSGVNKAADALGGWCSTVCLWSFYDISNVSRWSWKFPTFLLISVPLPALTFINSLFKAETESVSLLPSG